MKWLTVLILLIMLGGLPVLVHDPYIIHILILCLMYACLAQSWNLLVGFTGIFTFGHQAFFGIGAYISAILALRLGISPWFGLVIGGFGASLVGLIVGMPCLRLRAAPYIAIGTLGLAEISRIVAQNLVNLTRGEMGLWGIPEFPPLGAISFLESRIPYYYLIFFLFLLITGLASWIAKSPLGLALASIRESQDAAESLGVNVPRVKLIIFTISSFVAGVIGSFYAHYILILTPSSVLGLPVMIEIAAMVLIGGSGTLMGPIVGAFLVIGMTEYLRLVGDYRLMIYGAILVATMIYMPNGLTNSPLILKITTITRSLLRVVLRRISTS
jgi:branched-chain amino acid transport system permease protein